MARSTDPEITGARQLMRVTEDGRQTTTGGDLDVRNGPDLFVAFDRLEGTYGWFSMTEQGVWLYTLDNSRTVTRALTARGDFTFDYFWAETADGSARKAINVQVKGTDDVGDPAPTSAPATDLKLMGLSDFFA